MNQVSQFKVIKTHGAKFRKETIEAQVLVIYYLV
jgi:hypothetical protein